MSLPIAVLLAEGCSLDVLSGRLSVFNMLDDVSSVAFPAMIAKFFVVVLYEEDEAQLPRMFAERIRILDENQTDLAQPSVSELSVVDRAHRSIHRLNSIKLPSEGVYQIVVEMKRSDETAWIETGKRLLHAKLVEALAPAGQTFRTS